MVVNSGAETQRLRVSVGPIIGLTTTTSCRVLAEFTFTGIVRMRLSTTSHTKQPGTVELTVKEDRAVVFQAKNLDPASLYTVSFITESGEPIEDGTK